MATDLSPNPSIQDLSSRIRELLPGLGSTEHKDELATHVDQLLNEAGTKAGSEYTVPTHLRRIFTMLKPNESPAAREAKEMIKNYASSAGISL